MPENKELIFVGKITKSVGLKGYIKVISLTDFDERFLSLDSVSIFDEKRSRLIENRVSKTPSFKIEDIVFLNDHIRVKFENYNLSVEENMINLGYYRIYDSGKFRYVLEI